MRSSAVQSVNALSLVTAPTVTCALAGSGPMVMELAGGGAAVLRHGRVGAVDVFLQVGHAIAVRVAVGTVVGVGDPLAGVEVVVTDHAVVEGIEAVLLFPAVGQTVAASCWRGAGRFPARSRPDRPDGTRRWAGTRR